MEQIETERLIVKELSEADAEILLPISVHRHARGQRVRRIDQPASQRQSVHMRTFERRKASRDTGRR